MKLSLPFSVLTPDPSPKERGEVKIDFNRRSLNASDYFDSYQNSL